MFVPTIKYRKANGEPIASESPSTSETAYAPAPAEEQSIANAPETKQNANDKPEISVATTASGTSDNQKQQQVNETATTPQEQQHEAQTKEENREEPKIEIDPNDDERLLITLSTGKQYTTDRYCPHAGADLSYLGEVAEDEYPPEIGPIVVCTLHYWEFALEKGGRSGGGIATLNACPVKASGEQCPIDKDNKLNW